MKKGVCSVGKLNAVLQESIGVAPEVSIFGLFSVSSPIITSWFIMAFLVGFSILATRKLKKVPGKGQALLELAIGSFNKFCQQNLGKHWRPFAPWLGTVGLYILCCNLSGIFGVVPPTKTLSITATLALLSMVLIYGAQLRYRGLVGGLVKFAHPVPFLLPINLMEVAIRPLSLCMRLFGNVLASYMIMEMLKCLVPVLVPAIFSIYFDLFDGVIQTVVFVFLTTLFVGEGIEEPE